MCEEKGKQFGIRETAKGIATVTAIVRQAKSNTEYKQGEELRAQMHQVFKDFPQPVTHIIERMDVSSIFAHEVWDLDTVCPRWSDGNIVLIGDVCHAMTPGLGLAANVALEDAIELSTTLVKMLKPRGSGNIAQALTKFFQSRIDRVKEIHARSRVNSENTKSTNVSSRNTKFGSLHSQEFLQRIYSWRPTESN